MQKKRDVLIYTTIAMLVALTVFGSFWDLEISNALYLGQTPSDNIFGIIFSFIGIIPTFVGWSFLGASIFYLSKKQVKNAKKRKALIAFSVLLLLLSFFYFCNTLYLSNSNAFEVHFAVAYSIGIAVIFFAAYLGYRFSRSSDDGELLKKALFLAAVSLLSLIIISCTKEIMSRPRFRLLLAMDDERFFRSFWQSGKSLRESLGPNIVTDEFASFPSGHSAYSMFAIFIFPALSDYVSTLKKFKTHLFLLGFAWWVATALSRLTVGAHYLTDVALAGLITILAYGIVFFTRLIYTKRKNTKTRTQKAPEENKVL
ncbi:MAG: phosphatase PAP2 family protein [Clostridia bacterium]|nr:phosphatase PAP2 family protein [Clostridia bacterium]